MTPKLLGAALILLGGLATAVADSPSSAQSPIVVADILERNPVGHPVEVNVLRNDADTIDPDSLVLIDPATDDLVTVLDITGEGSGRSPEVN